MIGAIGGDIIGSVWEFNRGKKVPTEYPLFAKGCRFTDDSILSVALADALLSDECYRDLLVEYALQYPRRQ